MSRLLAVLVGQPKPEWRTNLADSLNVLRLIAVGAVAYEYGALWGIGVVIGGRIVLSLIDAVLAPV
jgi:hypothetical protein